ncbi:MAG TPA: prephenate dehydratase domain-containing protein, partial [Gaiellales bacterium]|nr:prephenate dehydratase domain-containing protein [Gaiellales bacterium]
MQTTVAYPGEEGAYAAEAGAALYPDAELRACRSFADVMRSVSRGEAGCGVLPIENSLAGAIPETYDLLAHAPLAIVDEVVIPVPHCLVGLAGANIDALTRIHSHPAALTQCRRFLSSLPDTLPDVAPSTAAAARRVADSADIRQ